MKFKKQKRKSDGSFLIRVSLDKKDSFDYASASQLAANTTEGLLPFCFIETKARPELIYDITAFAPLETVLKTKLSLTQWRSLLLQFVSLLEALHAKGFQDRNLVFDPEFVFVRLEDFTIQFIYLPLTGRTLSDRAAIDLLNHLARKTIFLLEEDRQHAGKLIDFLKLQSVFSLVELKDFLKVDEKPAKRLTSETVQPFSGGSRPKRNVSPGRDFITESTGVATKEEQYEARSVSENILIAISEDLAVPESTQAPQNSQPSQVTSEHRLTPQTPPCLIDVATGRSWELPFGPTVIGRSKACDIQVSDSITVSRKHAIILYEKDEVTITDNNSSNGTFVKGTRLTPKEFTPLANGDEILLGQHRLTIQTTAVRGI